MNATAAGSSGSRASGSSCARGIGERHYDWSVFTELQRCELRDRLVAAAREDGRVTAAAVVGSAAVDREDEWSDIDLALRLADDADPADVADDFTALLYASHGAVHHFDLWRARTLFRVFLLPSTLQVDLSFWPSQVFAASGASFRLLFGETNEPSAAPPPAPDELIGMGWLYALHARSSIARGRALQALYMINGLRDHVVSLSCVRHGLPAYEGRGVDDLPTGVTETLAETVVRGLDRPELSRAFDAATRALLREAEHVDRALAARLTEPALELLATSRVPLDR